MKVILENFGPIKRVEFDLTKDLNVIFGKNNIGKSYAITALYIILKHLLAEFDEDAVYRIQRSYREPEYNLPSKSVRSNDVSRTTLDDIAKEVRTAFRKNTELREYEVSKQLAQVLRDALAIAIEDRLNASFSNSFQSISQLTNKFSPDELTIGIKMSDFILYLKVREGIISLDEIKFHLPVIAKKSKINRNSIISDIKTTVYLKIISNQTDKQKRLFSDDYAPFLNLLNYFVDHFGEEVRETTEAIYFLPASRSGLYQALSTFGAVIAELSKSRHFVTSNFSLPNISEPVADYFLLLSGLNAQEEDGEISSIAKQIESEILGGEVGFNQQTKKLFFRQKSLDYEMDLSFTSSMISEIAPIVAFLKYILRRETDYDWSPFDDADEFPEGNLFFPTSLIFIEEPEAHLHPEVQVKLMEFFARLTKHNVKVVMTSHSNYMFNKLSNLLLTNELGPEKVGSYLMRTTPEGSVMDPFAMRAEEEGIADENFVDVAEQLYNERLEAYDKLNAQQ